MGTVERETGLNQRFLKETCKGVRSKKKEVREPMAYRQRIMIVDNDENIAEMISLYLTKEHFDTRVISDGVSALEQMNVYHPDLILLDLMLPGIDGYQVCNEIRKQSAVPIIILSAKTEVFDRVLGLELGADDYIGKPFDTKELTARIKAVLRRSTAVSAGVASQNVSSEQKTVTFDDLVINLTNYTVVCRGKAVEMPPKEIELLYFLASSPNQVFTREQLLNHIWGYDYAGDTRTVDVHIKRLREKLGNGRLWNITTVWGVGYKFSTGTADKGGQS